MKVKVRKIKGEKNLHIQYILPERDNNFLKNARRKYEKTIKTIRQAI